MRHTVMWDLPWRTEVYSFTCPVCVFLLRVPYVCSCIVRCLFAPVRLSYTHLPHFVCVHLWTVSGASRQLLSSPDLSLPAYSGDLDKAASHMGTFQELAHKHKWHTDSGDSLYEIACEHLRRIYTSLAERVCT